MSASEAPSEAPLSARDLAARLQSWLFEADFFGDCVTWARAHSEGVASDALTSRAEMRLAYTALHREFEAFFESKLEKFCLDAGATAEQVHAQLEAAIKEGGEAGASEVVDFITALADFETFMQMMTDVKRQQELEAELAAREAAEAAGGGGASTEADGAVAGAKR